MPQITCSFADHASVPDALKPFSNGTATVTVWAGDNVAAETNPALETKRTEILNEKKAIQDKYDELVKTTGETSRQLSEAQVKIASGTSATPEDLALVSAVKKHLPTIKASDLDKKLEAIPTLESKIQSFEAKDTNAKLFKASGFKNENVFLDLLGNKDKNPNLAEMVIENETVDGKVVEKVYAKVKDASGTLTKMPLTDYVKAQDGWKDYLPILNGDGQSNQHDWLPQEAAGGGDKTYDTGGVDLDAIIKKQNEAAMAKVNPLMPAPATTPQANAAVPQN